MIDPPKSELPHGSLADFHRLFLQNQRRIYGYILTLVPRPADAEDVAQDTFVVILSKADQFQPGTEFARWACHIAYLEVMNYRRRRVADRLHFDVELLNVLAAKREGSTEWLEARRAALDGCLQKLPASDRELLQERYQGKITSQELAQLLGRPANTVYKALQRIRRGLLVCIERKLQAEERQ